jgi:hypothetical protein
VALVGLLPVAIARVASGWVRSAAALFAHRPAKPIRLGHDGHR